MNPSITLRVERTERFASVEAAESVVAALVELARTHLEGLLAYGRTHAGVVHVSPANVSKWIAGARTPDFGVPRSYTHQSVLLDAPRNGAPLGGLSLGVGPRGSSGRGLVFVVRIDEARVANATPRALVDACSQLDVDSVTCGAVRWARGEAPMVGSAGSPSPPRPPSAEELRRLIDEVSLSIDDYARIRATIAVRPAQEDAIWCAHGVFDAGTRRRLEASMDERFAGDPDSRATFRERIKVWLSVTLTAGVSMSR